MAKMLFSARDMKYWTDLTTREDIKEHPILKELYDKLMIRGGKYISLVWTDLDQWIEDLVMFGQFTVAGSDTVTFDVVKASKMRCLECFYNARRVVEEYGTERLSVVMGMALLKNEKLWMQHAWVKDHEYNVIIETTPVKSSLYYGIEVDFDDYMLWVSNEDRFGDYDDWEKRNEDEL